MKIQFWINFREPSWPTFDKHTKASKILPLEMQVPGFTQCAPKFFGSNFHTPWLACIEIGARNKSQKVSSRSINSSFNSQVIKITGTAHTFPITYLPSGSTLKWIDDRCIFHWKIEGFQPPTSPWVSEKKHALLQKKISPGSVTSYQHFLESIFVIRFQECRTVSILLQVGSQSFKKRPFTMNTFH